jgi:glycyl-tRNA synthetase beta chain
MPELFIELFSEEIPAKLQIDARRRIKQSLEERFKKKEINFKSSKTFSTPKRLVIVIDGIPEKIEEKQKILKGPKVGSPQVAVDGFIKSNNLNKSDLYSEKIDKGDFYFAKLKAKVIDVSKELEIIVPDVFKNYSWKKSMKWANNELNWGRPLKSIVVIFNNKKINFEFYHLKNSDFIYLDDTIELKTKKVKDFNSYLKIIESQNIVLDHEKRKKIILSKMEKICNNKKLIKNFNENLIEEVVNIVERPNIIIGKFDEIYLKIPQEILIITMQKHQKYFPLFDYNKKITNLFLLVANLPDKNGYIKKGNQRVVEARLSDAKFFWEKNKTQSLVKQVSKLKSLSFFKQLGTFYEKTQRLRKLSNLISEQLYLSKEKIEISSSICKADLVSDLVGEYPELQGIMGKYFAKEQGFEDDICNAINDHYLPTGIESDVPKKKLGSAVALIDKIDTLVGFFGINEKPTSSKDPFALRRTAIGVLRIITENKLTIKLKDLIAYSIALYKEQNIQFNNVSVTQDILTFLRERFKNFLKDKKIRNDIIEAADSSNTQYDFLELYKKCLIINKSISNDSYKSIVASYKRASNIIDQELKIKSVKIIGLPEPILFKKDEEKNLFTKINEIRKYFSSVKKQEIYGETLDMLSGAKNVTDNFFDNVIVNDENPDIKKNRLELLQMFCKTYNNFIDFSKIEGA